jgi:hypothetical protein
LIWKKIERKEEKKKRRKEENRKRNPKSSLKQNKPVKEHSQGHQSQSDSKKNKSSQHTTQT